MNNNALTRTNLLLNQPTQIHGAIFSYCDPSALGNVLSTCKYLRLHCNSKEDFWKDIAKRLKIPESYGKKWRECVIIYMQWQKNIFQEFILDSGLSQFQVNQDREGNIILHQGKQSRTWNKTTKTLTEVQTYTDELLYCDTEYSLSYKKQEDEYIYHLKDEKNHVVTTFKHKDFLKVTTILDNLIFCRSSSSFYEALIYHPLDQQEPLKIKLERPFSLRNIKNIYIKNSKIWVFYRDKVLIHEFVENTTRTVDLILHPHTKDILLVRDDIFILMTPDQIIGFKLDVTLLENLSDRDPNPFVEIWRFNDVDGKLGLISSVDHSHVFWYTSWFNY